MISLFLFHSSLFPPLRGAGCLLSLCSPADCLRQAISAALRFAVLGSAFGISPVRRALIEADLMACMVALPGQPFYGIPFWKN